MPRFVREIASYAACLVLGAALVLQFAPQKVVVNTQTASESAPNYAQRYMDAMCALDTEYLITGTSPDFADTDEINAFVQDAKSAEWSCGTVKYLGSYQLSDKQVFAVVIYPGTDHEDEVFYALTFEDQLVTDIE